MFGSDFRLALAAAATLMACAIPAWRSECTRDGDCADGHICYYDDQCVPRAVAERIGAELGDACSVVDGQESGCEDGDICRMGYCRGDDATPVDGGVAIDAGDGLCTAGTVDNPAPLFGGVNEVVVDGSDAVILGWIAAADETPPEMISYSVFMATASGQQDFSSAVVRTTGQTGVRVSGLSTGTEYFFVVRAADAEAQMECNTRELSATPEVLGGCIDYETEIQSILDLHCVTCHNGPAAQRQLHLDSHAGVLAGGETGIAVVPCQPDSSLVYLKAALQTPPVGDRMPPNGPYLGQAQLDIIRLWIEQGAGEICPVTPELCSDDQAPTFAGIDTASLVLPDAADLCWEPGSDDTSSPAELVYDVYEADGPGAQDFVLPPRAVSSPGATCVTVTGLPVGQERCWVVRARDRGGNRDLNTEERCITVPN